MCFYGIKTQILWKPVKTLSKHLWRCPKKLEQQPLQEVHNHHNYVKNNFCIKSFERLLENVDDENNVSTSEEILTDHNECMQSKKKKNNNGNYVRCHYGKLRKSHIGLRASKCKNIFAFLFNIHNTISLSRHEQVCLSGLCFERYFSHHQAT